MQELRQILECSIRAIVRFDRSFFSIPLHFDWPAHRHTHTLKITIWKQKMHFLFSLGTFGCFYSCVWQFINKNMSCFCPYICSQEFARYALCNKSERESVSAGSTDEMAELRGEEPDDRSHWVLTSCIGKWVQRRFFFNTESSAQVLTHYVYTHPHNSMHKTICLAGLALVLAEVHLDIL